MLNKIEFIKQFTSTILHYSISTYKLNELISFYIDVLYVCSKEDNINSSVGISLIYINLENCHNVIKNKYVFKDIEQAYNKAYELYLEYNKVIELV